jgi:hypothetical protein
VTERNQGGDRFERPWTTVAPDAPRRARLLETITRVRIWERDELPWLTTEAARRGALELRQAIEADL